MVQKQQSQSSRNQKKNSDKLDKYLSDSIGQKQAEVPEDPSGNPIRTFLFVIVFVIFGSYFLNQSGFVNLNPFTTVINTITTNQPSEELLNSMNIMMVDMGYTNLSHDDLIELRNNGVTATYISNIRALGFQDLTLDQAVSLSKADASTTFMAMMIELGYELEINDFINLRTAGVTAHYTSNIHDLGYRDVTTDQLIRLRQIGVTTNMIERLQQERGEDIGLEEIIRYRISNQ